MLTDILASFGIVVVILALAEIIGTLGSHPWHAKLSVIGYLTEDNDA